MENCECKKKSSNLKAGGPPFALLCVVFLTLLCLAINILNLIDGFKIVIFVCQIVLLILYIVFYAWIWAKLAPENIHQDKDQSGIASFTSTLTQDIPSDHLQMQKELSPVFDKTTVFDGSSHVHLEEGDSLLTEYKSHASHSLNLKLYSSEDNTELPSLNSETNTGIHQKQTLSGCKDNISVSLGNEEFTISNRNCGSSNDKTNTTVILKIPHQSVAAEINIPTTGQDPQNSPLMSNEIVKSNVSGCILQNSNHSNPSSVIHHETGSTKMQVPESHQSNLQSPSLQEKNVCRPRFNILNYISRLFKMSSTLYDNKQDIATYSDSIDSLERKLDAFSLFPKVYKNRQSPSIVVEQNGFLLDNKMSQAFIHTSIQHKQGTPKLHQSLQKRYLTLESRTPSSFAGAILSSTNHKSNSFFNGRDADNTRKSSSLEEDLETGCFSDSEFSFNNSMSTLHSNSEMSYNRPFSSMFSVNDTINSESSVVSNIDLLQMQCSGLNLASAKSSYF